jgi:hypothetical protein
MAGPVFPPASFVCCPSSGLLKVVPDSGRDVTVFCRCAGSHAARAIISGVEALAANSQGLQGTANSSAWAFQCHPSSLAAVFLEPRK